jgi:hypothetical protein
LANVEQELLRLLVERPDLVEEAKASLKEPGFTDAVKDEAAGLLWSHPGLAVMQIQMEEGVSEPARTLLLDLALEQPHYPQAEAALPLLLARLQLERRKRQKAKVDEALRQGGEAAAMAEHAATANALALEIRELDRQIKAGR